MYLTTMEHEVGHKVTQRRVLQLNYLEMKRFLSSSILTFVLIGISIVVQSQNITLKQTSKSGIYTKGQKIIVKAIA